VSDITEIVDIGSKGWVSNLSAEQLVTFANQLGSASLHTLIDRREEIAALKTDQLRNMIQLGRATRASCGGIDCG
jgi:hypothetical protein